MSTRSFDLLEVPVQNEPLNIGPANEREGVLLEGDGAAIGHDIAHVTQHADLRRQRGGTAD